MIFCRCFALILYALLSMGCTQTTQTRSDAPDPLDALSPKGKEPSVLKFGITPWKGPDTDKLLQPVLQLLQSKGIEASAITADSYDALAGLVRTGDVHVGVFSPLAFVKAREGLPAVPLATSTRGGSPTYLGYLVVRASDEIQSLDEVRGKRIAWVHRSSTSGYLYPRDLLRSRGFNPDNDFSAPPLFTNNHEKSIDALLSNKVDVIAIYSGPTVDRQSALQVIAKTKRIPRECLVIHRDISRKVAHRLREALFAVDDDRATRDALTESGWGINGFVGASLKSYDEIAEILATEGKQ